MFDIKKIAIAISLISTGLLLLVITNPSLVLRNATTEFRNLSFTGKVLSKYINRDKGEKTHTIDLTDGTKYVLPRQDIDDDIEVGDSIKKDKYSYEIVIYKKATFSSKIIYALPYIQ